MSVASRDPQGYEMMFLGWRKSWWGEVKTQDFSSQVHETNDILCHTVENLLDPLRMIQNFLKEGDIFFVWASPFLEIIMLGHT